MVYVVIDKETLHCGFTYEIEIALKHTSERSWLYWIDARDEGHAERLAGRIIRELEREGLI